MSFFYIFLCLQVFSQDNLPAASKSVINVKLEEVTRPSVEDKMQKFQQDYPIDRSGKEERKIKPRKKFWSNFVGICGLLVWLCGLGTFFLFGVIGWWVILTAAAGIILGSLLILQAEKLLGSDMAGIGAVFYGFLGLWIWLLGILGITLYAIFT